jgi:WD40 repeat protein/tetratricopeptide (TPR) repeat protein
LLVTKFDKIVKVWDLIETRSRRDFATQLRGNATRCWFSADQSLVLLTTATRIENDKAMMALLHVKDRKEIATVNKLNAYPTDAVFLGSACRFVVAGQQIQVWDLGQNENRMISTLDHSGVILHASLSRDGTRIVTAGADGKARVWEAVTGRPITPPIEHDSWVWHASFSPDGTRVVTASGYDDSSRVGQARVWSATTGAPLTPPMEHHARVRNAAFSHDGRRIVTASFDGNARVWDAATGHPTSPPLRHNSSVYHAAFSPDDSLVATATVGDLNTNDFVLMFGGFVMSHGGEARVWDALTGDPVTPPLSHERGLAEVGFTPDGLSLFTSGWTPFEAWHWDISAYMRGLDEIAAVAEVLSGTRIDTTGGLVPVDYRASMPIYRSATGNRRPDDAAIRDWHRGEFLASKATSQSFATVWHLDRLIAIEPNQSNLYYERGNALMALGAYEKAKVDFSTALKSQPERADLHQSRGEAHAKLGQWAQASDDYAWVLKDAGAPNWAISRCAFLQLKAGHREGYNAACDRLLKTNPLKVDADEYLQSVAWTFVIAAYPAVDYATLIEKAESVVAIKDEDTWSYIQLRAIGGLLVRAGRLDRAVRLLKAATTRQEICPSVWCLLALCEQAQKRHEQAKAWLSKLQEIDEEKSLSTVSWNERLALDFLQKEAARVVGN